MNTDTLTPALSAPELRLMQFSDLPKIQRLEAAHGMETQPEKDWRSLWLDNPLWPRLSDRWPLGWVMEDAAGNVVGSMANVPSLYTLGDRELLCANGRAWVVAPEYRGFALWLMDEYCNQELPELFINTTVGPKAVEALSVLFSRVPAGDWETIRYWITGYQGFARKALEKLRVPLPGLVSLPTAAGLWLKDCLSGKRLPARSNGIDVRSVTEFDGHFDAFWNELRGQNPGKLLAVRDRRTLAWHYGIVQRRGRLWIHTAWRGGLMRAYCIFKRMDLREGLRRMRLIDYQTIEPGSDLLADLLHSALRRCAAEGYYALEHFGGGLAKTKVFDEHAPYRRKLPNWTYVVRVNDPELSARLQDAEVWDPTGYDGDASFE